MQYHAVMRHLTIRNVPDELGRRLLDEKRARGSSLNQTVLELLSLAVGLHGVPRTNGLRAQAGRWTPEEHEEFERTIAETERLDEELWR